MSKERALELQKLQSKFPYWGNYRRFMTQEELDEIGFYFMKAHTGTSFAGIITRIAMNQNPLY